MSEYASRVREQFIELQPGERKAWRLPPCSRGVFIISLKYSGAPSGGGGSGAGIPDTGPGGGIARYRSPTVRLSDLDLVNDGGFGGETGPALELKAELICGANVVATPAMNHPGHIFLDATGFEAVGDVWMLQVTRQNDGSIGPRRYRVQVTYPSVLPVKTLPIPASFFERGFEENWNANPYLEYVRITNNRIAFRWDKKYAVKYHKFTDDQYIPLPHSDWYNLPTIVMTSIHLLVGAEAGPWGSPEGVANDPSPYLMLELKCQCEGSRTVELVNPGPNILPSFDLPEEITIRLKLFLAMGGSYNSPSLYYYPVVESELLDMLNYDITYPTLSGMETINLKDSVKKGIEDAIYNLKSDDVRVTNMVNDYVRPYIVGQDDLYGIGWDKELRNILVSYVTEQDRPAPSLSPLAPPGGAGGGTNERAPDGPQPEPLPRLFETPLEMPPSTAPFPHTVAVSPGNLSKIDHIVVLMQENRSFDHILGYLSRDGILPREKFVNGEDAPGDRQLQPHVEGLLPDPNPRDVNSYNNVDYRSTRRTTTAWPSYALPGPAHGADAVTRQVSDGMKDFVMEWARHVSSLSFTPGPNDPPDSDHKQPLQLVMDYVTDVELPAYGALTREFAICDHWYCSHLGGTLPNRFISLTGHFSRDIYGSPEVDNPELKGFSPLEEPTFFDHLTARGVEWKLFEHGYSMLRLVRNYTFDEERILNFSRFEETVAAGLPPVTFIEPDYIETPTGISNDDHAPADMINGQVLVATIMRALLANPAQWAKTLFIITYDEHGGFYDHVPPPTHIEKTNPDGSVTQTPIPTLSVGEPRLGVRVPAFVISPFIPGADADGKVNVSHAVFDHTSIPATILRRFCGPRAPFMGNRWAAANDVGHLLTLDTARPDSDFAQLRDDMEGFARLQTARLSGDVSSMLAPPLRRPDTADEMEENFSGLIAFASSITGRGP